MSGERTIWQVSAVIEATEEQKDTALEAIARALCPDEDHPGHCPVPWTLMACRLNDLDPEERASWQEDFDEERRRARESAVPGTD
ncbi:MAG: hypothetical protein JWO37_1014 [Acidimicrobiales bacterium]|jgi:hypothetical protein|nr:hypothetical protein [Acidimicrobiales bacterium]